MPTYQYACTECGHAFDQVQSFSDDSLTECPVCAGRLRKLFNAVGVVFKGSGFYRTDSRSPDTSETAASTSSGDKNSGEKNSAEKGEKSSAEKTPAKKSGEKSETKAATSTGSSTGSTGAS